MGDSLLGRQAISHQGTQLIIEKFFTEAVNFPYRYFENFQCCQLPIGAIASARFTLLSTSH